MLINRELLRAFGQLFVMAFDGTQPGAETIEFLSRFEIGGVVLFEDNYESPDQLRSLVNSLNKRCAGADRPLLILTDHEGGTVQRFRDGFSVLPPAAEMGAESPKRTAELYWRAAMELRCAGVNVALAPVADVCAADQPGTIGGRSFGDDPDLVAQHVAAAVCALQGAGIAACTKHFPGHGATADDAHRRLPVVTLSETDLFARDIVPFRAAIRARTAMLMTAHAVYPQAGDDRPASLSPYWIGAVARKQLHYQGVIISDALEMKGLMTQWRPLDSGRQAFASGTDILMYYKESDQYAAFYELRADLERGEFDPIAIAESVRRVSMLKQWLAAM
jgi:beta-N-acetylhexosaminidase